MVKRTRTQHAHPPLLKGHNALRRNFVPAKKMGTSWIGPETVVAVSLRKTVQVFYERQTQAYNQIDVRKYRCRGRPPTESSESLRNVDGW